MKLSFVIAVCFLLIAGSVLAQPQVETIVNSNLWNTRHNYGHGGTGRNYGFEKGPSYVYPAGWLQNHLWASSMSILSYEPGLGITGPGGAPDFVATTQVYRQPLLLQTPVSISSRWAHPNSEYKEPFITETEIQSKTGIKINLTSYSWSYDYNHTNDLILLKYVFTNTGNLVAETASGPLTLSNHDVNAFLACFVYDFDMSIGITDNGGQGAPSTSNVDDQTSYAWMGNKPTGVSCMFDGDDPGKPGDDSGYMSDDPGMWFGCWMGISDIAALKGANGGPGTTVMPTIWGGPSIGMYRTHMWWAKPEEPGVGDDWYRYGLSCFFDKDPGYLKAHGLGLDQLGPNPDVFDVANSTGGWTNFMNWKLKAGITPDTDPYDATTFHPAPTPADGVNGYGDRKKSNALGDDNRFYAAYGPFALKVGESMTLWIAEVIGAGSSLGSAGGPEGVDAVAKRARELFQAYDPATGEFNIPAPPPAPKTVISFTPEGRAMIEWENNAEGQTNPFKNKDTFAGYRVYKSQVYPPYDPTVPATKTTRGNIVMGRFGINAVPSQVTAELSHAVSGGAWGPYVRVSGAEWTKGSPPSKNAAGRYYFEDKDVILGFKYWYYVSAYDEDGNESYFTMNANGMDGQWHRWWPHAWDNRDFVVKNGETWTPGRYGSAVGTSAPAAATADKVAVVPNPFKELAKWDRLENPDAHTIQFRSVPGPCKIEIYDISGVLIRTLDVPAGQGVAEWNMLNKNNMEVASGLYIFRVIPSKGGEKIGKFAIIR